MARCAQPPGGLPAEPAHKPVPAPITVGADLVPILSVNPWPGAFHNFRAPRAAQTRAKGRSYCSVAVKGTRAACPETPSPGSGERISAEARGPGTTAAIASHPDNPRQPAATMTNPARRHGRRDRRMLSIPPENAHCGLAIVTTRYAPKGSVSIGSLRWGPRLCRT